MSFRGSRGPRMAASLDDDDGLGPRRGARGGHELAGIFDRLDVQQNGPGAAIEREVVKQVAEIDVQLIPDRCDRRKSHRSRRGPFYETRGNRPGLRDQGQISRARRASCKTGIELLPGYENAETVGPNDAHAVC